MMKKLDDDRRILTDSSALFADTFNILSELRQTLWFVRQKNPISKKTIRHSTIPCSNQQSTQFSINIKFSQTPINNQHMTVAAISALKLHSVSPSYGHTHALQSPAQLCAMCFNCCCYFELIFCKRKEIRPKL